MREKIKNNSGYTLVETILVIAIIVIMASAAMLTVTSIRSSQATASMQRFDDEIANLEMRTKTLEVGKAMKIVQDGANYEIYYGTCTGGDASTFTADNPSKADAVLERVTIYYADDYNSEGVTTPLTSEVVLVRKSDGEVLSGYGQYRFCKYNTSSTVGWVTLNRYTGGHTYGKN